MNNDFWMKPSSRWIAAVGAGIVSFGCCCCGMYAAALSYLSYITGGNIPTDITQGLDAGQQLGVSDPLYGMLSIGVFCLPPLIMFPAALAGYYFVYRYQKGKTPAAPPPAPPSM